MKVVDERDSLHSLALHAATLGLAKPDIEVLPSVNVGLWWEWDLVTEVLALSTALGAERQCRSRLRPTNGDATIKTDVVVIGWHESVQCTGADLRAQRNARDSRQRRSARQVQRASYQKGALGLRNAGFERSIERQGAIRADADAGIGAQPGLLHEQRGKICSAAPTRAAEMRDAADRGNVAVGTSPRWRRRKRGPGLTLETGPHRHL